MDCACGRRHWGRYGAAGLLLSDTEGGVLLQHRAEWSHQGGTWGLPGGALNPAETPRHGALREACEEARIPADSVAVTAESVLDHGTWSYTTVLASLMRPITPRVGDLESVELRWVPLDEVAELPLHPSFDAAWPALRGELDRALLLVVDAANVVGSRPDGWWRDRAGATARLRDKLADLAGNGVTARAIGVPPDSPAKDGKSWRWWPRLTLVVEGKARGTVEVSGVRVLGAAADGDSAIVDVAREALAARPADRVLVATADRELRQRVRAVGASVLGPAALLDLLER